MLRNQYCVSQVLVHRAPAIHARCTPAKLVVAPTTPSLCRRTSDADIRHSMHKDLRYTVLGVSRQTISKWETDETLPDIRQSKRLALLYGVSLDELIEFDLDIREIQDVIDRTSEAVSEKIDWTKAWSKKYPVLARYRSEVDIPYYAAGLWTLLIDLEKKYGYNDLDAFLVLKDILAVVWKNRKKQQK